MGSGINYADLVGMNSTAAALTFAVGYLPLFGWFFWQSFGQPTYVFVILALFSASEFKPHHDESLADSWVDSAGESLELIITDQVLFGVGFFGLLYSAYTLVLDRWLLIDSHKSRGGPISRLIQNRRVFRVLLLAAVALGIAAAVQIQSNPRQASSLRIASTSIFLVLTVLTTHQTLLLAHAELDSNRENVAPHPPSLGRDYGAYILCFIALLLLVREGFTTATVKNLAKQYNERLWYPLYALPEILAVYLYAAPGLAPPRSELPA
ncbi:hypothetical protein DXG03_003746 [Asterophora parasitica]|uniref:Uncharacterized protein n=1 Tax=Asterophora parasitica TaxID=117018 RepID=A0A9P7G4P9_9AGAR|nr:hypothetical protein DXG03_003746 [Asterophora parasitica]